MKVGLANNRLEVTGRVDIPRAEITPRGGTDAGQGPTADQIIVRDGDVPAREPLMDVVVNVTVALGDAVKDVRTSHRLTDSPVCLIADEGAMDMHLERLLKAHNQIDTSSPRILEINPKHALIKNLASLADVDAKDAVLNDAAYLLLDQARIVEGEPVLDAQAFTRRMTAVMQKGIAA